MKLSISGWPGGGSTTLALVLCKSLDIKYVRGSETFRYLFKKLQFSEVGQDRADAHNYVEPYFGPIYDQYIDYLIKSEKHNNIIIESDIAAFRVGKYKGFLSIFLTTDEQTRAERTVVDNRPSDGEHLVEIDKSHGDMYKELHDINWFDLDEIKDRHQLVIDNSDLEIKGELGMIYQELFNMGLINEQKLEELKSSAEAEDKLYWEKGKQYYLDYLNENNLVMSPEDILREINKEFSEKIKTFPQELQNAMQL